MSQKKTSFSPAWMTNSNYAPWLHAVPSSKFLAGCRLCNSTFSLSNMGKQALTSHMKSKKHVVAEKSLKSCSSVRSLLTADVPATGNPTAAGMVENESAVSMPTTVPTPSVSIGTDIGASCALKQTDLKKSVLLSENTTKAEIYFCLHVAVEHMSFRSAERTISAMKIMCPDSAVANKMQLHRTKIAYTIVYGIAPYFKRELTSRLKDASYLVVGFDETLNKVSQKKQMDVTVRYWDLEKNEVSSRYLTSVFLGHSRAVDILSAFKSALVEVDLKKVVQVSMDGPNVNLRFLKDLKHDLAKSPSDKVILDFGSCGIHTLHGAFKTALKATVWDLESYLRAIYNLFKDVPARRADFLQYSNSSQFPKKFCGTRWGENAAVAKRALQLHDDLKLYVNKVEEEKTAPKCKSFDTVSSFLKDKLCVPKITFFLMMAELIEPFLAEFQGDAPLSPFLFGDLSTVVKSVMARFIKQEMMTDSSLASLMNINVYEKKNLKHPKEVNVGFGVRAALKKTKASDAEIAAFHKAVLLALQKFVEKMCERSPLKYKLTQGISCLDPAVAINPVLAKKRLDIALEVLVTNNWFSGIEADRTEHQFNELIVKPQVVDAFKAYSRKTRLDNFWANILSVHSGPDLKRFISFVLIFSHGNAFVERGFSINRECLLENQSEESLVALRQLHDTVSSSGGLACVNISKSLIHSSRSAYSFYKESIERKKNEEFSKQEADQEEENRRKKMKELQAQKMKLLASTEKEIALIEEEMKICRKK